MKFRKWLCLFLSLITILFAFVGCSSADNDGMGSGGETKLSDLSGKKVGVMTGSIQAVMMPDLVTDATYMEFNSVSDLIVALNSGKIDAFGCDESLYTSMLWEGQAVDRIDEPLAESNYGMILPKGKKLDLQREMNEYIAQVKADGSLKALEEKWFGAKEPTELVSYDDLNGKNGTITVAIKDSFTSLEEFGRKNQVAQKTIMRAMSVFEELGVQCLLPKLLNEFKLSVAFEYSADEEILSMSMKYDGEHFDVRNTPNVISLAIAENASESIEYTETLANGFTNLVTVKIK